ncbi:hypothetical protein A9Q96_12315 [Rhodobacterales bacterium 52_120_T64]|nr:hypothetical protein A9Q96_12315 [Rhodobacterales bacterium 52_120_T64]
MIDWSIQGEELANCNCNFGCPCQFSVLPTDGNCEAAVVFDIKKGHYGNVKLDGLRAAAVYKWPSAIHEGNGEMQLIIDEQANVAQRAALQAILTGEDTDDMATFWWVFAAMAPNKHETLYKSISADLNAEDRIGIVNVSDVFEIDARPIPHIMNGTPHRARINLPNGFEFGQAEAACGSTTTTGGAISLDKNQRTHAHFASLHLTGAGVVR